MNIYQHSDFRRLSQRFKPWSQYYHNTDNSKDSDDTHQILSIKDFKLDKVIGKGGFGVVYRAYTITKKSTQLLKTQQQQQQQQYHHHHHHHHQQHHYHDQRVVALKVIDKTRLQDEALRSRLAAEVALHQSMNNPAIVQMYDFFEDNEYLYMVQEYCACGDLWQYLKDRQQLLAPSNTTAEQQPLARLSEEEARTVMLQICRGVIYMHEQGVLHRDLKLTNLLLTRDMEVRIADFGLATQLEDIERSSMRDALTVCGTWNYMAPEIIKKSPYGFESDIWAIGCLFITLLTGIPPFSGRAVKEGYNINYREMLHKVRLPPEISEEARDLANQLLQVKAKNRIRSDKLLTHQFFSPVLPTRPLQPLSSILSEVKGPIGGVTKDLGHSWGPRVGHVEAEDEELASRDSDDLEHYFSKGQPYRVQKKVHNNNSSSSNNNHVLTKGFHRKGGQALPPLPPPAQPISNPHDAIIARAIPLAKKGQQGSELRLVNEITAAPTLSCLPPESMLASASLNSRAKPTLDNHKFAAMAMLTNHNDSSSKDAVSHLTTAHLPPCKHKLDSHCIEVMPNGHILLTVMGDQYVTLIDPLSNPKSIHLYPYKTAIFKPSKAYKTFYISSMADIQALPSKSLAKKVTYVIRCIDKIRSKTRKVILKTPQGQAMLMENLPIADFHYAFHNGIKAALLWQKRMAEIRIPCGQDLPDEIHQIPIDEKGAGAISQGKAVGSRLQKILAPVYEALERCLKVESLLVQWELDKDGDGIYVGKVRYPVYVDWKQNLNEFIPPGLKLKQPSNKDIIRDASSRNRQLLRLAQSSNQQQHLHPYTADTVGESGQTRALSTKPSSLPTSATLHQSNHNNQQQQQQHHHHHHHHSQGLLVTSTAKNNGPIGQGSAIDSQGLARHGWSKTSPFNNQQQQQYINKYTETPLNRYQGYGQSHRPLSLQAPKPLQFSPTTSSHQPLLPPIIASGGSSDRFQYLPDIGWCIYRPLINPSYDTPYLVTPKHSSQGDRAADHELILLFTDGIMMVIDSSHQYIGWWDQTGSSGVPDQQFYCPTQAMQALLPPIVQKKLDTLPFFINALDLEDAIQ